jgi:hypothetical protein
VFWYPFERDVPLTLTNEMGDGISASQPWR